ncbi:MAG: hypothetical protein HY846_07810 [Nitrosomonadales bacterium]|nr:hypothetical protein [Nitrosomonadales bacterium]
MKHAKYFSILVFVAMLGYGATGFRFLPLASFDGDLTRMGQLPESLFGWAKPQPALDAGWMQQASMREADVLVIGDSFSDSRVWQTALTQRGMKVRTESLDSIRGLCADFMFWLRAQGFAGKYVVYETVERDLASNLNNSIACQRMEYHPNIRTDAPRGPPAILPNTSLDDYSGRLSVGILTRLNALKYEFMSSAAGFKAWALPNSVIMARVPNGCALFSHARCSDVLFLSLDKPGDVDEKVLEDMETLNARLNGVIPVWVFVPNKSTAYLNPDKQFWNRAEQRFNAPNLLRLTQQAIGSRVVDLYPANNTHFSTTGYLLMGEEIFKVMQQAQSLERR